MPDPLPIERLHHVALVTRRPEESIAFYREVLGFEELQRPGFDFRGAWLYNYGLQIHIIENLELAGDRTDHIDTRGNHLAFAVTNYEAARRTLENCGIPFHEQVNAGGIRQIFFQDPDGHHIEVAIYPPNPPKLEPSE